MRLVRFVVLLGFVTVPFAMTAAAQDKPTPGSGPVLVFETEKGIIEIETYPAQAPKTVAHIVGLVNKRFYNGLRVHRVVPNFVIQLGDPASRDMTKKDSWGRGGSGTSIGVAEFAKNFKHAPGIVSMAHAGDAAKADSQFFIVTGPASHLDGKHQIFGKVITGMDVVKKIAAEDRIIRATVKGAK
ncbi:MAG TPA: peptidylprolyl isomerase [Vicinamibacterales bacterium]|nr:peptidylprolyl isomerase [Vicinamibacterales bacterium]